MEHTWKNKKLYETLIEEKVINSGQLDRIVEDYKKITQDLNIINPHSSELYSLKSWNASEILALWKNAFETRQVGKSIDLYVNVPFCENEKKCSFCMYSSIHKHDAEKIGSYLKILLEMIRTYQPVFEHVKFNSLYFGGGTPNMLNANQMDELFSVLFDNFKLLNSQVEKTFENSPGLFSREKIDLLVKYGFNRVSFGVQSFEEDVLKNVKRDYYSPDYIKYIVGYCKKMNIRDVNVDLMLGLKGQTKEKFVKSLIRAFEAQPDTVTVYVYRHISKDLTDIEAKERYLISFFSDFVFPTLSEAYQISEDYGYFNTGNHLIECQHFVRKNRKKFVNRYRTQPFIQEKNSCLGLGAGSRSYINSPNYMLKYNMDIKSYSANSLQDTTFKGDELGPDAVMRVYAREELYRHRKINLTEFKRIFECDFTEKFRYELYCLQHLEKVKINGSILELELNNKVEFGMLLKFFYTKTDIDRYLNILSKRAKN